MPEKTQQELEKVIEDSELMEVENMVTNLETTLINMRKKALQEGKQEGRLEAYRN